MVEQPDVAHLHQGGGGEYEGDGKRKGTADAVESCMGGGGRGKLIDMHQCIYRVDRMCRGPLRCSTL